MFDQYDFGKRLKTFRTAAGLTQKTVAQKLAVSEQAVSKWENGVCLPDAYNLKLLARVLHTTADCLLDTDGERLEVIETFRIGGAVFELVEKPAAIFAGKIICAKDYADISEFDSAIETEAAHEPEIYKNIQDPVLPICDVHLSVNFWRAENSRAYGFVREVLTENQPDSVDVFKNPASLYIRAYTDAQTAQLMAKESCEIWELFAYIRNYLMPAHGFEMASNGAQELEIFDTFEHKSGCAYMPVKRI